MRRRTSANCSARSIRPTRSCCSWAGHWQIEERSEPLEQPVDGVVGRLLLAGLLLGVALERGAQQLDLGVGQMLDADERFTRLVDRAQQLVELGLDRSAV